MSDTYIEYLENLLSIFCTEDINLNVFCVPVDNSYNRFCHSKQSDGDPQQQTNKSNR